MAFSIIARGSLVLARCGKFSVGHGNNIQLSLLQTVRTVNAGCQKSFISTDSEGDGPILSERDRDVSGLPPYLRQRMKHAYSPACVNLTDPESKTRKQLRKLYGKHGHNSGIDPGIMWPTKEEIQVWKEDEKRYEQTLYQMWDALAMKKKKEEDKMKQRIEEVDAAMKVMEIRLKELRAKRKKWKRSKENWKAKFAAKGGIKMSKKLHKAQKYFGFPIKKTDAKYRRYLLLKSKGSAKPVVKSVRAEKEKEAVQLYAERMKKDLLAETNKQQQENI
ncbi:growth arrest and DNA damage-inducible proteins-interacting protein 1 [Lingula anatina]|uniref:Large ribosomal subunit protein mL64 n=1 Tax=Lingula anatina TaxID=7574 RepID=A0A1S3JU12_LINAN|nr:growth arrest and DNA damage-inducible proteins-interacting protein 1 [Lingula anatina]|eukprot:XP_013413818.1 growth arrest and DNA damage-inducible proteins-interacting protein 1 [Lingula anatina]